MRCNIGRAGVLTLLLVLVVGLGTAAPATALTCAEGGLCPNATDDSYTTTAGAVLSVSAPGVLANDDRPAGTHVVAFDSLSAQNVVVWHADGSFRYTSPATSPTFTGDDTFSYTIDDGLGNQSTGIVTATVVPTIHADSYSVAFNATLAVDAPGVLANDIGMTGVVSYDSESANGGTVDLSALDGSLTYVPAPCYSGSDTFNYTAEDANGTTLSTTVTIHVGARPTNSGCNPCFDASLCPIAVNDNYGTSYGAALNAGAPGVLKNDFGAAATPPIANVDTSATIGDVTLNLTTGALAYVPAPGFVGADAFAYTIDDGSGNTSTATVHVVVAPKMLKPTAVFNLSTSIGVAWTLPFTGSVQLQYQATPWNGGFGTWSSSSLHTFGATSLGGLGYGRTYCFRARTAAGGGAPASSWAVPRCTAIPLRATGLAYSSGWRSETRSGVFGGIDEYTTTYGARAVRTGIQAKKISLIVTKCATCGSIRVYWNGALIKSWSLTSATTLRKQVLNAASFSTVQSGTLTIVVTSAGKKVILEGLAVSRV